MKRDNSPTVVKQEKILTEIKRIHSLDRLDDYGSPRMHREIMKLGIQCSKNTVAKLMRCAGIRARLAPRFRITTTDSNHDLPIAPNRLNQQFTALTPNRVWLTDFTYITTKEGFTYLCTIQDLCSRKIVGWATSRSIDTKLAIDALNQATALRRPEADLIVHSDRGSQFASVAYRRRLLACRYLQSMSRKGNCYDNAPMESFFKSYKTEEVSRQQYQTHEHATRGVIDYVERFYNKTRIHSSLGYKSPNHFEAEFVSVREVQPA
jgi:transposase InsO family protein